MLYNLKSIIWSIAETIEKNYTTFTETYACGSGEWSIEIYCWNDEGNKQFVGELVGSNGNGEERVTDDLHSALNKYTKAAQGLVSWFSGGYTAK